MSLPPLALYLHFPWCVQKCPYCDFNSHQLRDALPEQRYIDALAEDLAAQAPLVGSREIVSIFMGGGTPSLFPPSALSRLLGTVRDLLRVAPDAELTMEANPATVERGRFAMIRRANVPRSGDGVCPPDGAVRGCRPGAVVRQVDGGLGEERTGGMRATKFPPGSAKCQSTQIDVHG
jgi:oxygen-independent coproporphyrinogen-3 oxidase